MISKRKLKSNRENSKKSRGPKTVLGKRVSSLNAIRHGLSKKNTYNPTDSQLIEEIMAIILSDDKNDKYLLMCAYEVAESLIDISKVRKAKMMIWEKTKRENASSIRGLFYSDMESIIALKRNNDSDFYSAFNKNLPSLLKRPLESEDEIDAITCHEMIDELQKLIRYERRAINRFYKSVQLLDEEKMSPRNTV